MFAVAVEVSRIRPIPTRKRHAVTPRKTLFLVLAGLLMAPVAAEDLKTYIWRDADGNVHYGDNPPQHEDYQEKTIPVDGKAEPSPGVSGGNRRTVVDDDDDEPRGASGDPERALSPEDMAAIAEQEQYRLADDDDLTEQPRTVIDDDDLTEQPRTAVDDDDTETESGSSASSDAVMPPPAPPPPLIGP